MAGGDKASRRNIKPPFNPETDVIEGLAKSKTEYVRVISDPKSPVGRWMMLKEDFEKIMSQPGGPKRLKELYALPNLPTHFVTVSVPKGTHLRIGTANEIPGFGKGGAVQVQITERLDEVLFGQPHSLSQWRKR